MLWQDFNSWEYLIRIAESADGGLTPQSTQETIANMRNVFDQFLAKFPLCFGYWKKYADFEFMIQGPLEAEKVFLIYTYMCMCVYIFGSVTKKLNLIYTRFMSVVLRQYLIQLIFGHNTAPLRLNIIRMIQKVLEGKLKLSKV